MKILLDFNAIVGREDIFKPITWGKSLQDRKNVVLKCTMFPHRNIHTYSWTPPDNKTIGTIRMIMYR